MCTVLEALARPRALHSQEFLLAQGLRVFTQSQEGSQYTHLGLSVSFYLSVGSLTLVAGSLASYLLLASLHLLLFPALTFPTAFLKFISAIQAPGQLMPQILPTPTHLRKQPLQPSNISFEISNRKVIKTSFYFLKIYSMPGSGGECF